MSMKVSEFKSKIIGRKIEDITVATLEEEDGETHDIITIKLDNGDVLFLKSYCRSEKSSYIDVRYRDLKSKKLWIISR